MTTESETASITIPTETAESSPSGESAQHSCQPSSERADQPSRPSEHSSAQMRTNIAADPVELGAHTKAVKQRIRRIQTAKAMIGGIVASLTVLIPKLDELLDGTGNWAVITVLIVLLDTPGATVSKATNRVLGTVVAALVAAAVGTGGERLERVASPSGSILIGATLAVVVGLTTWLQTEPAWKDWSYALLLSGVTYSFLVLETLNGEISTAAFRAGVIAGAALGGVILSLIPPHILAADMARSVLADALTDSASTIREVIDAFLCDKELHPRETIYANMEKDDVLRQAKLSVLQSREILKAAEGAAAWEACWASKSRIRGLARCGRSARAVVYTAAGLDELLRHSARAPPLRADVAAEAQLAEALAQAAQALTQEHASAVRALGFTAHSPAAPITLTSASAALQVATDHLIRSRTTNSSAMLQEDARRFALHVTFARLLHQAISGSIDITEQLMLAQAPQVKPPLIRKSTTHIVSTEGMVDLAASRSAGNSTRQTGRGRDS